MDEIVRCVFVENVENGRLYAKERPDGNGFSLELAPPAGGPESPVSLQLTWKQWKTIRVAIKELACRGD